MASEKDVEDQLFESGNKLVVPPSSVDELLPLLDSVEKCLLNVEQSPGESMQTALAPSLKALVDDKLLRHSDVDVKVAVASCISEITRITAPEAPYDDDRMKEVFQLIVSSFENLSDNKSRSYAKRTSILQTVAKVRSCVVMLDLECDALIVEMFQHFLDSIRDHHPENVITAMETIMTLVLEESEDISMELLSPILACVKNDSKEVLPIARGLGKKVLLNCAEKVKPYLVQAVKALDSSITDYDEFVANICQGVDGDAEQTKVQADEIMANEGEPVKLSSDMEAQDNEEVAKEAASEKIDPSGDRSPQSALSNGVVAQTGESTLEGSSPVQKQEDEHPTENTNDLAAENVDSLNPGELANTDEEVAVTLGKEETTSSPVKSSDSPFASNEKKLEGIPDGEGQTEDIPSPHHAVPSAAPVEKEENSDVKGSPSKTSEPPSVSPARNTSEEILEKAEPCEKDSSGKEASRSLDDSKKVADAASDPGAKPDAADAQKKMPAASSAKTKASEDVDVPMKDSETTIVPTVKPSRYARKKVLACDSDEVKASDEVDIPMKDSEDISDSEVKHSTRSRKKFATGSSGEIKASAEVDVPMKDSEDTSDLEVKHSRRSRKKVAAGNSAEIKASADGDIPMKDSDSEVKHGRHARKKAAALRSGDIKASAEVDAHMKDNEATSDSEAKPLKQSVKKVDGGSKKKAPMKDDEATSDSEEKPLKQSVKKVDGGSKKNAPVKDSEATSDSEEKPLKKSVKKVDGGGKKNASVKESEAISDSEEKSLKQSVKKGDGSSKKNVKAISSKQEDKKTSARRKSVGEKDTKKAPAKDNTKDTITSPKSSGKPIKDEDNVKETPMTDPKRKRTPGKEKEPAKDFGESLVDSKIRVYWPEDKKYYDGTIVSFDSKKKKHTVLYNDGDEETLNLRNERWEFIGRGSRSDDEEETAQSGPEDSTEMPLKKRSKIKPEEQSKQKKVQASPKKGGGGSSSKSKATITPKSRSGSKSDSKSKDEKPAKSAVKSEDQTPKSGGSSKSTIISFKSPSKSKNSESQTPKGSTKSNEESTTKSKGTTTSPKPQGKSSTKTTASKDKSGHGSAKPNGTGKSKSGSSLSKAKELEKIAEEVEERDDEETGSDELKEKSKGGEPVKSGKKRRRSVKG